MKSSILVVLLALLPVLDASAKDQSREVKKPAEDLVKWQDSEGC